MSVNRWIHACNLKWLRGQSWRPTVYWYQQQFRSIKTSENGPLMFMEHHPDSNPVALKYISEMYFWTCLFYLLFSCPSILSYSLPPLYTLQTTITVRLCSIHHLTFVLSICQMHPPHFLPCTLLVTVSSNLSWGPEVLQSGWGKRASAT